MTLEEELKRIGDRLVKLRKKNNFGSYESFANQIDMQRMQYWKMEKGHSNFTMKSLIRVLKEYNITVDDFFKENF